MVLELTHTRMEEPSRAAARPSDAVIATPLDGKRVVIVEDEALTVMQVRRILRAAGLDVIGAAANGRQAVDLVMREPPDIVLMDINMPVMNGIDATREILARHPICIIMLTAYSDPVYVESALDLGAAGYVLKPIDSRSLMPHIETAYRAFLNRPPQAA
jgi:YesN/AraC family two-component response regulator